MKLWKKILLSIVAVTVLIAVYFHVPVTYSGKIIDADTGEPLEGAVVVAKWNEETATIAGGATRLKDAKEILTDKSGEWQIIGPRGMAENIFSAIFSFATGTHFTRPPTFIVFKPGYCSVPKGFGIDSCRERMNKPHGVKHLGSGEIISLPRLLNRADRRINLMIGPINLGDGIMRKQRELIKLLNIEYKALGMEGYEVPAEFENGK